MFKQQLPAVSGMSHTRKFIQAAACVISVLLCACASAPRYELAKLADVPNPKSVTITSPIFWSYKSESALHSDFEQGLLAGVYVGDKQNAEGTFFRGPDRAFFERGANSKSMAVRPGGFWVPTGRDFRPRLFFVNQPPELLSNEAVMSLQNQVVTGTPALQRANVGGTAAGTAIGLAVIEALNEAERGKIVLLPELKDAAFVSRLRSGVEQER